MRSKTSRGEGLVPRWGRCRAWQNPPCQFAVPIHNSNFSYLGVPTPAGMSDCYESMSWTPIRDRLPRLISSYRLTPARTPIPDRMCSPALDPSCTPPTKADTI